MKRVALYVRVSHEEQVKHGISVDAQIYQLKEYAKTNDMHIVDVYNDAGISARKSYKKRPELLRLIKDCQQNKIDLVLVTKLDRFFRSVPDYYAVMEQMNNTPWKAIHEDYETETSSGMFKVNIMLSVAQSEADRTSERIKSTFDYKRSCGEYIKGHYIPLGYKLVDKKLIIDKETECAVRAFFNAYINYHSMTKAMDVAREYGMPLKRANAYYMIRNPVYYEKLPYIEQPYFDDSTRELIERNKTVQTRNKGNDYNYIFSGLVRCEKCGSMCVCHRRSYIRKKDGKTMHMIRYVCGNHKNSNGCPGSSITEKTLEQFLFDSIKDALDNYNLEISLSSKSDSSKELSSLESRLNRLKDLYELGDIDFAEYKNKRIGIIDRINELKKEPTLEPKVLPENWQNIYSDLDSQHKRAFWFNLIQSVNIDSMNCKTPKIRM